MNVIGLVSIPGMMTGQVLGGSPPLLAAKYQAVIMFLICFSSAGVLSCALRRGAVVGTSLHRHVESTMAIEHAHAMCHQHIHTRHRGVL